MPLENGNFLLMDGPAVDYCCRLFSVGDLQMWCLLVNFATTSVCACGFIHN